MSTSLASLPDGSDGVILPRQFKEQLSKNKGELSEICNLLFALDLKETDELNELLEAVEKSLFDRSLYMKKSLLSHSQPTASSLESKGVKLPKTNIPTFDGNLLHWTTVWEQFNVAVHRKSGIN